MALYRFTMVLNMVTDPAPGATGGPHAGGITESFWAESNAGPVQQAFVRLMVARANLLPNVANIVGAKVAKYDQAPNYLTPQGSISQPVFMRGGSGLPTDVPQLSLQLKLLSTAKNNTSKAVLRMLPDDCAAGGEYRPTLNYPARVTAFIDQLTSGTWGFIGRNKTFGAVRVMSLAGGVLQTSAIIPGVAQNDFVRLLRVRDVNGKPVVGIYQVTNIAGFAYTLKPSPAHDVVIPSGTVRKDGIDFIPIDAAAVDRVVIKKVGRPSQLYRGRRSNKK